jgi:hypothetical protein
MMVKNNFGLMIDLVMIEMMTRPIGLLMKAH